MAAVKATCDGCGSVVSSLKKVEGKYLCRSCAKNPAGADAYFCAGCHSYFAYPAKKGSGWIELVLYLCYLVPGILYSIWRRSGPKACPKCRSTTIISASAGTHVKCPDCAELILRDAKRCKHCGCTLVPQ